jgi:hypothetical protein
VPTHTRAGIRVRSALSTAIYGKALRSQNIAQHSSDVLNLLTNDCFRLLELCTRLAKQSLWRVELVPSFTRVYYYLSDHAPLCNL